MKSLIDIPYETEGRPSAPGLSGKGFSSLPVGLKLAVCVGCSFFAFMARTPMALSGLVVVNMILYFGFRSGPVRLKRELKLFFWQTLMIVGLYGFRFGFRDGLFPGVMTSGQLFLAFFPGVVFIQSTSQSQLVKAFSKVMSGRSTFVLTMSLRFLPLILRDIKTLYEAQVFRGAKILPADLANPLNWRDVMHCLVFPITVHCMVLASEIALAAKSRDFMKHDHRTIWPGN